MRALITVALAGAMAPASAEGPAAAPWLGITFDDSSHLGARVIEVHPGTAAAAAGLQPGDEIIEVGSVAIRPNTELAPVVARHKIGKRMPISFLRDGRRFHAAPRLTVRPASDEIVYQRLINHALPVLDLYDRQNVPVAPAERRRPQVWMVSDVLCERCTESASALAQRLEDDGITQPGGTSPLRVVLVGRRQEVDAYLARVPVSGTVWRLERDEPGSLPVDGEGGRMLLAGLDPRVDGTVLVVDHSGEVQFATSLSAGDAVHESACAAIARSMLVWRRAR